MIEKIIGKYRAVVDVTEHDCNPRTDEDNLSIMLCFHKRYNLGDQDHDYDERDYDSFSDMLAEIKKREDPLTILPLYLLDHSGCTISVGSFGDRWDSGMIGFVFVSKQRVREEYGVKRISKKIKSIVDSVIDAEVKIYDAYLKGEVYEYKLYDGKNLIDSSFGFYDANECLEAACELIEQ